MTMMGAAASFFLKKASDTVGIKQLLRDKYIYIGGFLYIISAILNIILLRLMPYSVILPLTSITYIWSMLLSYFFLKEKITLKKIFGVAAIFIGAVFIA